MRKIALTLMFAAVGCAGDPNVDSFEAASKSAQAAADACEAGADGGASATTSSKKTVICHIPPGNPANAHTIRVGNAAVKAHLAHGDTLGACVGSDDPCGPEELPGDDIDGNVPESPSPEPSPSAEPSPSPEPSPPVAASLPPADADGSPIL